MRVKKFKILLALVSLNLLISGQSCSDLRVYLLNQNPQNITNQIIFGTNYDSLVYVNPNTSAVNAIYDWRCYPPVNHNWNGNSHVWQSSLANPTYHTTFFFNDSTSFFILSLSMGDTATSPIPVTNCLIPFYINSSPNANGLPTWNLTMLNSNTDVLNPETKNKKLINTFNLAGQIINLKKITNEIIVYLYSDGSTEKKFIKK